MDFIETYLLNQLDLSLEKRRFAMNLIHEYHYPSSKLLSLIQQAEDRQKLCLLCFCDTLSRTNQKYFFKEVDNFINLSKEEVNETNKRSLTNIFLTYLNNKTYAWNSEQENTIVEICFSWLINDSKVATKCNCISCLAILSKKHHWIGEELFPLIEKMYPTMPASFQSRAKAILKRK